MSNRKPLEPVRVVRAHAVDAEAVKVRAATDAVERARGDSERAKSEAAELRAELESQIRNERASVQSARDHAQLEAFRVGCASRIAAAEAAAEKARTVLEAAERALAEQTRALAAARASLDIVEKHQERARETFDRDAQERIDEAAEEGFAARFRRS